MSKSNDRFQKVYSQGVVTMMEIFHKDGYAAGFTPLLGADGKPVVSREGLEP